MKTLDTTRSRAVLARTGIERSRLRIDQGWIDTRTGNGISMPSMSEHPTSTGRADGVPGVIKILGAASFTLSVGLVLLVHHYWTTLKCPIPQ
jgi:hypothetical protein